MADLNRQATSIFMDITSNKLNDFVKAGYKHTELGVIPEDWDALPLSELTTLMTNGFVGIAKIHYTENDDGILYIQGYNVQENSFNFKGIKRVSFDFHKQHKKSCLREGDLLTVQTGDVGLTTIVPKALEGSNCHALIITRFKKERSNSKFFTYYLNSFQGRARLKEIEIGTTMKHINVGDMLHFLVPFPPTKTEQTAIAKALSDTDALIQSLDQLIAKKCLIKQGAMQQLLNPYDKRGELKSGWVVETLGTIANIYRGASPRPIENPIWFDNGSKIGWVRISDITKSKKYLFKTVQKLSEQGIKQSRFIKKENLIMSICATVGHPILTKIDVCIHDGFVVFDDCEVDKQYLYYFLSFIEPDWSKNGQTGSQMNLNTGLINNTEFPLPEKNEEQTQIAQTLSDMETEITILETKRAKYQKIKQGMMQNLLTGRIRLI